MSEKQPTRYELIAKDGTSHGEFHAYPVNAHKR